MNNKRILFYSSVKNKELFFIQQFYQIDIGILKDLGFSVLLSNNIFDAFSFWKYDIAYIYFYRYGFFTALIAKLFAKKVYFTGGIDDLEQEYATRKRYNIQKFFFKLCYIISNKCILVSSSDLENVKKLYGGRLLSKITLSFHSIDIEKFTCSVHQQKNNNFATVLWMGNKYNVERKGVDLSLKLFSLLVKKYKRYSDSIYIIIGKNGDGTKYLESLIDELNIKDKVKFYGEIEEETKIKILQENHYYFQLSKYEGFGIAALEALITRNIVINSGKGGLKDSVNKYGVWVDIHEDLEKQIDRIHRDIMSFNTDFFKLAEEYITNNFSNNRRTEDLKKILY